LLAQPAQAAQQQLQSAGVKERSAATETELYTTFNMGQGRMLALDQGISSSLRSELESLGLKRVGVVDETPRVKIKSLEIR
jgi:phosphoribosylaminoimidazole (AIR) synthetase